MDRISSVEPNLLTRDVIGRMCAVTLDASGGFLFGEPWCAPHHATCLCEYNTYIDHRIFTLPPTINL
jgi:hypothetical protein